MTTNNDPQTKKAAAFQAIAQQHHALLARAQAYLDALRQAIASGDLGANPREFLSPSDLSDVAHALERRVVQPMRNAAIANGG